MVEGLFNSKEIAVGLVRIDLSPLDTADFAKRYVT